MSHRREGPAARSGRTGSRPSAARRPDPAAIPEPIGTEEPPERRGAYGLLRDQYFLLDRSFNRLFAAATSDEQRDALRRDYVTARDAYWEAQNRVFLEDDPLVEALERDLAETQATIEERIETLDDVAAALAAIAESVRIGGALVALGAGR